MRFQVEPEIVAGYRIRRRMQRKANFHAPIFEESIFKHCHIHRRQPTGNGTAPGIGPRIVEVDLILTRSGTLQASQVEIAPVDEEVGQTLVKPSKTITLPVVL